MLVMLGFMGEGAPSRKRNSAGRVGVWPINQGRGEIKWLNVKGK